MAKTQQLQLSWLAAVFGLAAGSGSFSVETCPLGLAVDVDFTETDNGSVEQLVADFARGRYVCDYSNSAALSGSASCTSFSRTDSSGAATATLTLDQNDGDGGKSWVLRKASSVTLNVGSDVTIVNDQLYRVASPNQSTDDLDGASGVAAWEVLRTLSVGATKSCAKFDHLFVPIGSGACTGDRVNAKLNTNPLAVKNRCVTKCGSATVSSQHIDGDLVGQFDGCDGNTGGGDDDFAFCGDYKLAMDLAISVGASAIEYSTTSSRFYLNSGGCMATGGSNTIFEVVAPGDSYYNNVPAYGADNRHQIVGAGCQRAVDKSNEVSLGASSVKAAFDDLMGDATLQGFIYDYTNQVFYGVKNGAQMESCNNDYQEDPGAVLNVGVAYFTKSLESECVVSISGTGVQCSSDGVGYSADQADYLWDGSAYRSASGGYLVKGQTPSTVNSWMNTARYSGGSGQFWTLGCSNNGVDTPALVSTSGALDSDFAFNPADLTYYLPSLRVSTHNAAVSTVACRGYSTCGSHQCCVMDSTRMDDELTIGFGEASVGAAATSIARGAANAAHFDAHTYVLNGLMSSQYAVLRTAVQGNEVQKAACSLQRHAAGSSVLEVAGAAGGAGISLVVATLVDTSLTSSIGGGHGDEFSVLPYAQAGATAPSSITLDLYVPGASAADLVCTSGQALRADGKVTNLRKNNWVRVVVDTAHFGSACRLVTSVSSPVTPTSHTMNNGFQLKLTNMEARENGWATSSVKFYTSTDCTGSELQFSQDTSVPNEGPGHWDNFMDETDRFNGATGYYESETLAVCRGDAYFSLFVNKFNQGSMPRCVKVTVDSGLSTKASGDIHAELRPTEGVSCGHGHVDECGALATGSTIGSTTSSQGAVETRIALSYTSGGDKKFTCSRLAYDNTVGSQFYWGDCQRRCRDNFDCVAFQTGTDNGNIFCNLCSHVISRANSVLPGYDSNGNTVFGANSEFHQEIVAYDGVNYDGATLTLSGRNMPANRHVRAKVMLKSQSNDYSCAGPTAGDFSCTATELHQVTCNGNKQYKHTICSSKPTSTSPSAMSWDVFIQPSSIRQDYHLCLCNGSNCNLESSWFSTGRSFEVDPSDYTWSIGAQFSQSVARRLTSDLELTVQRPTFRHYSNPGEWNVKAIPAGDDCARSSNFDALACSDTESEHCSYNSGDNGRATINGPDSLTLAFSVGLNFAEVGDYKICFRQSSSHEWTSIVSDAGWEHLTFSALPLDLLATPALKPDQAFGANGGKTNTIKIAASDQPIGAVETKFAVTGGSCSDSYNFNSPQSSGPLSLNSVASYPSVNDGCVTGGSDGVFLLQFSDEVTLVDAAHVTVHQVSDDAEVDCSSSCSVVANGNTVEVGILGSALADGESYYVSWSSAAIAGIAGGDTKTTNVLAVDAACTASPQPLTVSPGTTSFDVLFSSRVAAVDGTLTLRCTGADNDFNGVDDTAELLWLNAEISGETVFGTAVCGGDGAHTGAFGCRVKVSLGFTLPSGKCTAEFSDGSFAEADSSAAYDRANSRGQILTMNGADLVTFSPLAGSSASSLLIDVELGIDIAGLKTSPSGNAQDFSVCACNVETSSFVNSGDGSFALVPSWTSKCAGGSADYVAASDLPSELQSSLACSVKCAAGCEGESCQCDNYVYGDANAGYQMCGTLAMMKAAIGALNNGGDYSGTALGFDFNAHTNIGYIVKQKSSGVECANLQTSLAGVHQAELQEDEHWTHYDVQFGTHCSTWSDFSETVGSLIVTNRAYVGMDVVMAPNAALDASLEVFQPSTVSDVSGNEIGDIGDAGYIGLTSDAAGNSADRLMVIDCGGTCGRTDPSGHVTVGGGSNINNWIDNLPVHWFESGGDPLKLVPSEIVSYPYETHSGQLCVANMDHNVNLSIAGVTVNLLEEFGCYNTCKDGCTRLTGDCDCSGFLGMDGPDSQALCMGATDAQHVCDALGGACSGFNIMAAFNRVYLNTGGTCTWEDNPAYNTHVKDNTHESLAESATGCPLTEYVGEVSTVTIEAGADFDGLADSVQFFACSELTGGYSRSGSTYTFDSVQRITSIVVPALSTDTTITVTVSGPSLPEVSSSKAATAGISSVVSPRRANNLLRSPFDIGSSWEETLRYRNLAFGQGGTFKICFCDSARLSDGICGHKSDFAVDLGTVHVSGVSCLLSENRFQRRQCRSHFWGQGMTCTEASISLNVPTINDSILESTSTYTPQVTETLNTFCLYGPEEETYGFKWCQIVAEHQSQAGS